MSDSKNTSKAKKIYNIVSTTVIALIFVFLIVIVSMVLVERKSGSDANILGYYMYDVISDSMEPTIEVGDIILAKRVEDVNSLKEGDVITFVAPSGNLKGYNITHRIVEVKRDQDGNVEYFRTKGDNPNVQIDAWKLNPSDVKAKYAKTSKFLGWLRRFMSKWYGYVTLIVVPITVAAALVIAGYVRDKLAEQKEAAPANVDELTDDQKRKLLEEYLKSTDDKASVDGDEGQNETASSEGEGGDENASSDGDNGAEVTSEFGDEGAEEASLNGDDGGVNE